MPLYSRMRRTIIDCPAPHPTGKLREKLPRKRAPARRRLPNMIRTAGVVLLPCVLAGCDTVVLNPSGDVAVQQRNLIIMSTVLMLLIIVPV